VTTICFLVKHSVA